MLVVYMVESFVVSTVWNILRQTVRCKAIATCDWFGGIMMCARRVMFDGDTLNFGRSIKVLYLRSKMRFHFYFICIHKLDLKKTTQQWLLLFKKNSS